MSVEPTKSSALPRLSLHPATVCLAAGLILLPLGYRIPWDISRAIPLVLLAPALWLGRDLVTRRINELARSQSRMLLVALVFAAATFFSILGTVHWAASLTTASSWCLLALTGILVAQLVREDDRGSRILLGAMVISVGLATALHWYRWKLGGSSFHAFYAHPRIMGLHTLSGALASVGMLLHSPRPSQRIVWLLLGIVAWGGFFWSGSRSPLLGAGVGGIVWLLRARGPDRIRLVGCTTALVIGGLLLSLAFWTDFVGMGWWHVAQRTAVTQSVEQITSNRSSFWADSVQHATASPWIGYGPDGYSFLTPKLEGMQPHNLVLQLLLDVGAPGTIAALVLIVSLLWQGWRRSPLESTGVAWLAIACGTMAAAQFDGYLYYPIAAIPAFVALGACTGAGPSRISGVELRLRDSLSKLWKCTAGLASAILLLNCWLFHVAFNHAPPLRPDAPIVRLWQIFPSVTYNIDNWVDAWAKDFPDEALATSLYARARSQSPEIFRVKSARLLAGRGAFEQAIAELELARMEVAPEYRSTIDEWLRRVQAAVSQR